MLIIVRLGFEIILVNMRNGLPCAANLLHYCKCAHCWIGFDNFWSGLFHKDHVGGKTLLRLLDCLALLLKMFKLTLVPFLVYKYGQRSRQMYEEINSSGPS